MRRWWLKKGRGAMKKCALLMRGSSVDLRLEEPVFNGRARGPFGLYWGLKAQIRAKEFQKGGM